MLRIDLDATGIPYAVEGPDGPEYADFHSLRHSFLTLGGRSGIDLRTLQELAGHSKPELTARYSHRRLHDLAGAMDKLPDLVPTTTEGTQIPLRMTGTDAGAGAVTSVVPAVVTGDIERHQSALMYTSDSLDVVPSESTQTHEMKRAGASLHRPASIGMSEDDGTRTRNHRIDSPIISCSKANSSKQITTDDGARCSAGCSDLQGEGDIHDADLARLMNAWPTLPEPIKAAIRALIGAVE
jgi:hypothetical protein